MPAFPGIPSHMPILRPGYLPSEDLPRFLPGCYGLASPTMAEGFGLPVLDAIASRAAVLPTRDTTHP